MPALPSPGNVLRIEFKTGDNASIEAGSRFYIAYTGGPPNTTDLNTLASDVAGFLNTYFGNLLQNTESWHGVTITDLSSSTGAVGTWTGTNTGSNSGGPLPASICAIINHQINRRYRGGKPRTYMRLGADNNLNGTNEWTSTFQGDITGSWHNFVAAILAVSSLSITLTNIVNVSWYEGFTTFTTPSGRVKNIPKVRTTPLVDVIQNSSTNVKLGSQRRRLNV